MAELEDNLSVQELAEWSAFYTIKHDEEEKAMKKAKNEARAKNGGGARSMGRRPMRRR